MNNVIETLYKNHADNEIAVSLMDNLPTVFTNPNAISAWRHNRSRCNILPLVKYYPGSRWITVGDGSYGSDAFYLQNNGLDVLATSISDTTLSISHKLGYIKKFKPVNAENIPEKDNSFDFVFCKEAFHHFPRPFIALYEMLRVADKGVILIEPQENKARLLDVLKRIVKIKLRKDKSLYFEKYGNFIYRININELSKVMTALNHKYIAYKNFNNARFPGNQEAPIKGFSKIKIITFLGIGFQNLLCRLRLMDYGLATVILFKNDVDSELLVKLQKGGFHIKTLPLNPYL